MKTLGIVVNPVGAEREARDLRELIERLELDVRWYETTEDDPGIGQARAALADGCSPIVACGGDGTVRAVAEALTGTDTPLAVVPAGTGNLLARNLGIPADVPGALNAAVNGSDATLDVGVVNDEIFTVMAGAGVDAAIMSNTSRRAKETVGSLAYVATAGKELTDPPEASVRIEIDGEQAFTGHASNVLVGNCGRLQMGVELMPDAEPTDGLLDLLVLDATSIGEWVTAALSTIKGEEQAGLVERGRGASITVDFDRPMPYQLDGESRPDTRELRFTVRPADLIVRAAVETP